MVLMEAVEIRARCTVLDSRRDHLEDNGNLYGGVAIG